MTATTPAPVPEPAGDEPGGLLGRLRAWFERDVEPRLVVAEGDLAKVKADVANVKGLGPQVAALASIVEKIAEAADPSAAPEIAALATGAGKVAARIGEIVASLEASGV